MSKVPLYEIAADLQMVLAHLDETGELAPDVEATLDALQLGFERKLEQCCYVVKNLSALAEMRRAEARRLAEAAAVCENAVERLKRYVKDTLQRLDLTSSAAGLFKVRVQANSQPKIVFEGDPGELPFEFQRTRIELNTEEVLAAWKEGRPLPDGVAVTRGCHLRIN